MQNDISRRSSLKWLGGLAALAACGPNEPLAGSASQLLGAPDDIAPRNPGDPSRLQGAQRRVLIIGGGLAGLSAALELAERGYQVNVREAAPYLGGRVHTRTERLKTGTFRVEHGLHMWFHHYFVSQDILTRIGTWDRYFKPFEEVYFLFDKYKPELLSSRGPYPLNLLRILQNSPNLNLLDAIQTINGVKDVVFYNHAKMRDFDTETLAQWAKRTRVNEDFYRVVMEPASSVTLNDPKTASAAEMLLYMHYYFIGSPKAFNRRIPTVDHGTAMIDPLAARIAEFGGQIELNSAVPGLRFAGNKVLGATDRADTFDEVVLATEAGAAQRILTGSQASDREGEDLLVKLRAKIAPMRTAPAYHVLRIWFGGVKIERPWPQTVIEVPEFRPINLIALYHLLEDESRAWANANGGSVVEFHLYTTPELKGLGAEAIWQRIRPQALRALPELQVARVLDYALGAYENFTSFDVGQAKARPESLAARNLGLSNLGLAGDWLHTAYPSALMERAVATGRDAANAILLGDGVRQVPMRVATSHGPGFLPSND